MAHCPKSAKNSARLGIPFINHLGIILKQYLGEYFCVYKLYSRNLTLTKVHEYTSERVGN